MKETPSDSNKKLEKRLQEEKENDVNSSSISLTETTKSQFTQGEKLENKNIFVDNLVINKQQEKDFEHSNTLMNNKFNKKEMAEKSELDSSQQKNNKNALKSPPQPPPKTNVLSKLPWKRQQQPLVVIPKRRKHKNHISKRKGNRGALGWY
uniref:Uncharacterized protein n=1 Tax=Meloidogyne hapla TaxID=6305 RepID=A0A1I8AZ64_MELHA